MKRIQVVAAAICDSFENPKKIFATEKGYGNYQGKWEFPGGKIEPGESPEEALIREIQEELDVRVEIGPELGRVDYHYPEFHVQMSCYFCRIAQGNIVLKEASDAKWLGKDDLFSVDWLPSDRSLIKRLEEIMGEELLQ